MNPTVLIVGAGPAGLTAAAQLGRYGVDVLLVERRAGTSTHPRATAMSTRSMEIMRSWGTEERIRAHELDVRVGIWMSRTLASDDGEVLDVGWPDREQAAAVSPTAPSWVTQDYVEPVLLGYAASHPTVEVRFETELVSVEQGGGELRARVRDRRGGRETVLRPRYLIGADGPRSVVRTQLDMGWEGEEDLGQADSVLFHAALDEIAGERRYGLYSITHPEAEGTLLPVGRPQRWLYAHYARPGVPRLDERHPAAVAELIATAAGAPGLRVRIESLQRVIWGAQLAERFRAGNVFLAGDAAHRSTPRGGMGMNLAIHAGYDLGWKLAFALRGWGGEELLDSYEAERRPVGAHNVKESADPNGSLRTLEERLAADLGSRLPHLWLRRPGPRVSTLDLLGEGLTLLTGPHAARGRAWAAARGEAAPITSHVLDQATARGLGIDPDGAILLRPDGQEVSRVRAARPQPGAERHRRRRSRGPAAGHRSASPSSAP